MVACLQFAIASKTKNLARTEARGTVIHPVSGAKLTAAITTPASNFSERAMKTIDAPIVTSRAPILHMTAARASGADDHFRWLHILFRLVTIFRRLLFLLAYWLTAVFRLIDLRAAENYPR